MHTSPFILLGLAILAYAFWRTPKTGRPVWFQHLKGWRKVFGLVAVIVVVLTLLNPELLAFGLVGDTALFEVFTLLLSLQLQMAGARVWSWGRMLILGPMRWLMIPGPGMSYLLAVSVVALGSVVSTAQKLGHRLSP